MNKLIDERAHYLFDTPPLVTLPPYRRSAVLVLIESNSEPCFVLTLRSPNISHPHEISFAGGRSEHQETPYRTAIREAKEEIGIHVDQIEFKGYLPHTIIQPSAHIIYPVVAVLTHPYRYQINPDEVIHLIKLPIQYCIDHLNIQQGHIAASSPFELCYRRHRIWGATARIIHSYLSISRLID